MGIKPSAGRKAFLVSNYVVCILVGVICLLPVIHVFALSFSSKDAIISGWVNFWPRGFNLDNYYLVTRDAQFFTSYLMTFKRVILGWGISIVLTMLAAYPMSQRKSMFPVRPFFVVYFMIPMIFSGGMIPTYLVVKDLGMLDTIWSLVLPGAVSTYNMILMMNFMKGLPEALSEAALIDGAGHFRTLASVVFPLCKASVATVSLFIILSHWNAWFDGMLYINRANLKPLQTYLRSVIIVDASLSGDLSMEDMVVNATADGANGAKIFLAMLPILCIYPFMQKHFAKGIVRGSVKE